MKTAGVVTENTIKNTSRPKKRRQPAPSATRKQKNNTSVIIYKKGMHFKIHALFC